MKTVNVHEAKTHLSRILKEIESGETYLISRSGEPVAELRPFKAPVRTTVDSVLSQIEIAYDPVEELSGDEWGEIE